MGCAQYCAADRRWPVGGAVDVAHASNARLHPRSPGCDGRPVNSNALVLLLVRHLAGRSGCCRSTRQAEPCWMRFTGLYAGFFRLGPPDIPVFIRLPALWHLVGTGLSHHHNSTTAGVYSYISAVAASNSCASF